MTTKVQSSIVRFFSLQSSATRLAPSSADTRSDVGAPSLFFDDSDNDRNQTASSRSSSPALASPQPAHVAAAAAAEPMPYPSTPTSSLLHSTFPDKPADDENNVERVQTNLAASIVRFTLCFNSFFFNISSIYF
jgi:hypothetical protein